MSETKTIACPQCGEATDMSRDNRYRPFCSRRCKLIDLGDWLDESNRIPDPDGTAASKAWSSADDDVPH